MIKNVRPTLSARTKISIEKGAKPKSHELFTAQALADAGYNVRFIANSNIKSTADCYINRTIFEIKAPEGRTIKCIERNLQKALHHQSVNIVIDSFRIRNIQDENIKNFLIKSLRRGRGIKRLFFVNRKRQVIDINSLAC